MEIKVKCFKDVCMPQAIENGDWIDLRCAETIQLAKGNYCEIPLGIAVKLPKGYEAHVVPRSSTFKKWGIIQTNGIGIIDNSYCGDTDEWKMPVIATKKVIIPCGMRIAQFRIVEKMGTPTFKQVRHLATKSRGGLGSTGEA